MAGPPHRVVQSPANPQSNRQPDQRRASHGPRRRHVPHRVLDRPGRAGARPRGARLRVGVVPRAHPHPGEPQEPMAGRGRAAPRLLVVLRSLRRADGGGRSDEAPQARHRHLPRDRARSDRHRQGGGHPRPALGRPRALRHRRRLERRGDGEPRDRVEEPLAGAAGAGARDEDDLDGARGELSGRVRPLREDLGRSQAPAEAAPAHPHRRGRGDVPSTASSSSATAGCRSCARTPTRWRRSPPCASG